MSMKFTKVRPTAPDEIQMNAGLILTAFDPSAGTYEPENIVAATTGGISFTATAEFVDFGDDIDNCPKNTMEFKEIDDIEVKLTGTFLTVTPKVATMLAGAADREELGSHSGDYGEVYRVTPRKTLEDTDFQDLWVVGDRGRGGKGFIAIHLMNALNTGGFQMQTTDKGKGNFAVDITGHYSIDDQDTVPYEIYIAGGADPGPGPGKQYAFKMELVTSPSEQLKTDDEVAICGAYTPSEGESETDGTITFLGARDIDPSAELINPLSLGVDVDPDSGQVPSYLVPKWMGLDNVCWIVGSTSWAGMDYTIQLGIHPGQTSTMAYLKGEVTEGEEEEVITSLALDSVNPFTWSVDEQQLPGYEYVVNAYGLYATIDEVEGHVLNAYEADGSFSLRQGTKPDGMMKCRLYKLIPIEE